MATIIGTVVSGMLIEAFGYFSFFIFMGAFVSIVGVIGVCIMREGPDLRPMRDEKGFWHQLTAVFNFKTFVQNKELFYTFFIMTVYFICFNFFFVHIGNYFIYTLGYSEGTAGIIQGVGLLIALAFTIPAVRFINNGRHAPVISAAIIAQVLGLLVISVSGLNLILTEVGIVLTGMGYVLLLQTTTAWVKNLYPEGQRGQYEGIRIIFFVLIPMVVGPAIASPIIKQYGKAVVINGVAGTAPSSALFLFAAVFTVLTFIPLYFAHREKKRNA